MREWLRTNWLRLKALFRRKQLEQDLEDELAFHFAQRGDTPRTRKRFGSEAFWKEQTRELWTFPALETFMQDVRFTIRQLIKHRGSSAVAILTLALGMGASTAIFSVIDAAMLRPLPYPDPEQLVEVGVEEMRAERVGRPTPSMDDLRLWESADDIFTSVAGWDFAFRGRIVEGPEPERIRVLEFTEDYLSMHGVTPVLGRGFTLEDTEPGSPAIVLLGYGYWQSRYEGREDVVGESIRLDDGIAIIVGVLPQSFRADIPLFRPLRIPPEERARRGTGRVNVYGRLRPGITIEQAREWLSVRMAGLVLRDGTVVEVRTTIDSLLERTVSSYETTVRVLVGAVGLILLLACVNVAGLLLARGTVRQSELAVRASIGASPGRLIRQLLTESLVLALAGGLVGVGLAWLALDAIVANIPMSMPPNSPVEVNHRVLIATAAMLIPTAILFGLAPALRLSRARIRSGLAQSDRQVGSALSRRGSQFLVSAEIALAVILVASAGLMIRTVMRLSAVDLGFNPEGLVTMEVVPLSKDPNVHRTYYSRLVQQLDEMPGVASAGAVNYFPLGGSTSFLSITVEGKQKGTTAFGVVPGYFKTIGATLRDGRLPTHQELASGQCGAVVNSFGARELFGGGPAVGRQLGLPNAESCTVVGVIADIRHGGPLGGPVASQIYLPYEPDQHRWMSAMIVVLRPASPVAGVEKELRRHAEFIGPPVLIERIRSANDWFGDRMVTPRRRTILLGLLGGLGLILALVGVFGMTSYAVARRTVEIGVRMAFGAESYQVVRKMLWDSALPILIGTAAGLLGAVAATRVIESFLFETEPTDPITFAIVALTLVVTGCVAALIPARRAARVDPVTALRCE